MRSPRAQIKHSGLKWQLVCGICELRSSERRGSNNCWLINPLPANVEHMVISE